MNKIVKAVANGQKVELKDLFNSVNNFELTRLREYTEEGHLIMSIQINKFTEYKDSYGFSQSCTMFDDIAYSLKKEDILSVKSNYDAEIDTLYISCILKNGHIMSLMIIHTDEISTKDYDEMDVYQLKNFLDETIRDENKYCCISARITDLFGFDLKITNATRIYVNTLNEDAWKLHISNDLVSYEVPVIDDSINEFYVKDNAKSNSKTIIVKPFNQPFMEINLLFLKKHSN